MGSKAPKPSGAVAQVQPAPPPPQEEKESDAKIKDAVDKSKQRAASRAAAAQTVFSSAQGDLTVANVGKQRLGA